MALKGKIGIINEEELRDIKNAHLWEQPDAPKYKGSFKYVEACAGIGGFRISLEGMPDRDGQKGFAGLGGKCLLSIENNPACVRTLAANFGPTAAIDITMIDPKDIPDHDFFVAGFPCQTFSILGRGKRRSLGLQSGLGDPTKGSIFGYCKNIIEVKRPPMFMLENVLGVLSDDKGQTIRIIRSSLRDLGYEVFDKVLTSVFWVPQHRRRLAIVGFDARRFGFDLIHKHWVDFPEYPVVKGLPRVNLILDPEPDPSLYLSNDQEKVLIAHCDRAKGKGHAYEVIGRDDITNVLVSSDGGGSGLYIRDDPDKHLRHPSPREYAGIMGFPKSFIPHSARTVAKHQFGNAIVPGLFRHVAAAVLEARDRMEEDLRAASRQPTVATLPNDADLARLKDDFNRLAAECEKLECDAAKKGLIAVEKAYLAGEILYKVKELVGHGHFGAWKAANMKGSNSTAANYMTIFSHVNAVYGHISSALEKHADGWSVRELLREFREERRFKSGQDARVDPGDVDGGTVQAHDGNDNGDTIDRGDDGVPAQLAAIGVLSKPPAADDGVAEQKTESRILDPALGDILHTKSSRDLSGMVLSEDEENKSIEDFRDRFYSFRDAAKSSLTADEYSELLACIVACLTDELRSVGPICVAEQVILN